MVFTQRLFFVFSFSLFLTGAAFAQDAELPLHDLGEREIGKSYPLKLTAKNINCETAQDFEFEIDNMPWLDTTGDPIIRNLGPSESKTLPSKLDFQYTTPGVYFGRMTARCITCGWFIFATCVEQGQDIVMKVTVIDPASDKKPRDKRNPYSGLQADKYVNLRTVEPVSDDLIRHLKSDGKADPKQALVGARAAVEKAERQGQDAQGKLRKTQKSKSDCERKRARLKTEAANAESEAKTAKQAARDARKADTKAANSFRNFRRDNKRALTRIKNSGDAVIIQKQVLEWAARDHGTGSPEYQNAQGFLKDAQDKHFATLKEHSEVTHSEKAREEAALAAKAALEQAEAAAEKAYTDAVTARKAYDVQARLCENLADAVETARENVDDAKQNAADKVKARNKAETRAAVQIRKSLDEQIEEQENKCDAVKEDQKKRIKEIRRAMKAGAQIGILDKSGGASSAKKMQEINDRLWKKAEETAESPVNIAEAVSQHVTRVQDFGASTILGAMEGFAIGLQGLNAALNNPNTRFGIEKNHVKVQELKDKGYKDAEDLMKTIKTLHGDRNYLQKQINRNMQQAANCLGKVLELKAKREQADRIANQRY